VPLKQLLRQPSLQIAAILWVFLTLAGIALSHGTSHKQSVVWGSVALIVLLFELEIVHLLTRRRPTTDLAQRAPERAIALRETIALWLYGATVLIAGRIIGIH